MAEIVALRKESVDRNFLFAGKLEPPEMVALRKESVDRNCTRVSTLVGLMSSLSARRAWIEIALLDAASALPCGRSPQGERG